MGVLYLFVCISLSFCVSLPTVAFPFLKPMFEPIVARTSFGRSFEFLTDSASKIVETREKEPATAVVSSVCHRGSSLLIRGEEKG